MFPQTPIERQEYLLLEYFWKWIGQFSKVNLQSNQILKNLDRFLDQTVHRLYRIRVAGTAFECDMFVFDNGEATSRRITSG